MESESTLKKVSKKSSAIPDGSGVHAESKKEKSLLDLMREQTETGLVSTGMETEEELADHIAETYSEPESLLHEEENRARYEAAVSALDHFAGELKAVLSAQPESDEITAFRQFAEEHVREFRERKTRLEESRLGWKRRGEDEIRASVQAKEEWKARDKARKMGLSESRFITVLETETEILKLFALPFSKELPEGVEASVLIRQIMKLKGNAMAEAAAPEEADFEALVADEWVRTCLQRGMLLKSGCLDMRQPEPGLLSVPREVASVADLYMDRVDVHSRKLVNHEDEKSDMVKLPAFLQTEGTGESGITEDLIDRYKLSHKNFVLMNAGFDTALMGSSHIEKLQREYDELMVELISSRPVDEDPAILAGLRKRFGEVQRDLELARDMDKRVSSYKRKLLSHGSRVQDMLSRCLTAYFAKRQEVFDSIQDEEEKKQYRLDSYRRLAELGELVGGISSMFVSAVYYHRPFLIEFQYHGGLYEAAVDKLLTLSESMFSGEQDAEQMGDQIDRLIEAASGTAQMLLSEQKERHDTDQLYFERYRAEKQLDEEGFTRTRAFGVKVKTSLLHDHLEKGDGYNLEEDKKAFFAAAAASEEAQKQFDERAAASEEQGALTDKKRQDLLKEKAQLEEEQRRQEEERRVQEEERQRRENEAAQLQDQMDRLQAEMDSLVITDREETERLTSEEETERLTEREERTVQFDDIAALRQRQETEALERDRRHVSHIELTNLHDRSLKVLVPKHALGKIQSFTKADGTRVEGVGKVKVFGERIFGISAGRINERIGKHVDRLLSSNDTVTDKELCETAKAVASASGLFERISTSTRSDGSLKAPERSSFMKKLEKAHLAANGVFEETGTFGEVGKKLNLFRRLSNAGTKEEIDAVIGDIIAGRAVRRGEGELELTDQYFGQYPNAAKTICLYKLLEGVGAGVINDRKLQEEFDQRLTAARSNLKKLRDTLVASNDYRYALRRGEKAAIKGRLDLVNTEISQAQSRIIRIDGTLDRLRESREELAERMAQMEENALKKKETAHISANAISAEELYQRDLEEYRFLYERERRQKLEDAKAEIAEGKAAAAQMRKAALERHEGHEAIRNPVLAERAFSGFIESEILNHPCFRNKKGFMAFFRKSDDPESADLLQKHRELIERIARERIAYDRPGGIESAEELARLTPEQLQAYAADLRRRLMHIQEIYTKEKLRDFERPGFAERILRFLMEGRGEDQKELQEYAAHLVDSQTILRMKEAVLLLGEDWNSRRVHADQLRKQKRRFVGGARSDKRFNRMMDLDENVEAVCRTYGLEPPMNYYFVTAENHNNRGRKKELTLAQDRAHFEGYLDRWLETSVRDLTDKAVRKEEEELARLSDKKAVKDRKAEGSRYRKKLKSELTKMVNGLKDKQAYLEWGVYQDYAAISLGMVGGTVGKVAVDAIELDHDEYIASLSVAAQRFHDRRRQARYSLVGTYDYLTPEQRKQVEKNLEFYYEDFADAEKFESFLADQKEALHYHPEVREAAERKDERLAVFRSEYRAYLPLVPLLLENGRFLEILLTCTDDEYGVFLHEMVERGHGFMNLLSGEGVYNGLIDQYMKQYGPDIIKVVMGEMDPLPDSAIRAAFEKTYDDIVTYEVAGKSIDEILKKEIEKLQKELRRERKQEDKGIPGVPRMDELSLKTRVLIMHGAAALKDEKRLAVYRQHAEDNKITLAKKLLAFEEREIPYPERTEGESDEAYEACRKAVEKEREVFREGIRMVEENYLLQFPEDYEGDLDERLKTYRASQKIEYAAARRFSRQQLEYRQLMMTVVNEKQEGFRLLNAIRIEGATLREQMAAEKRQVPDKYGRPLTAESLPAFLEEGKTADRFTPSWYAKRIVDMRSQLPSHGGLNGFYEDVVSRMIWHLGEPGDTAVRELKKDEILLTNLITTDNAISKYINDNGIDPEDAALFRTGALELLGHYAAGTEMVAKQDEVYAALTEWLKKENGGEERIHYLLSDKGRYYGTGSDAGAAERTDRFMIGNRSEFEARLEKKLGKSSQLYKDYMELDETERLLLGHLVVSRAVEAQKEEPVSLTLLRMAKGTAKEFEQKGGLPADMAENYVAGIDEGVISPDYSEVGRALFRSIGMHKDRLKEALSTIAGLRRLKLTHTPITREETLAMLEAQATKEQETAAKNDARRAELGSRMKTMLPVLTGWRKHLKTENPFMTNDERIHRYYGLVRAYVTDIDDYLANTVRPAHTEDPEGAQLYREVERTRELYGFLQLYEGLLQREEDIREKRKNAGFFARLFRLDSIDQRQVDKARSEWRTELRSAGRWHGFNFLENQDESEMLRFRDELQASVTEANGEMIRPHVINLDADEESGLYSKEVLRAVHDVDQIVASMSGDLIRGNSSSNIAADILNRPIRERLFVYYMIEHRKMAGMSDGDTALSQYGYVPDAKSIEQSLNAPAYMVVNQVVTGVRKLGFIQKSHSIMTATDNMGSGYVDRIETGIRMLMDPQAKLSEKLSSIREQRMEALEPGADSALVNRQQRLEEFTRESMELQRLIEIRDSAVLHKEAKAKAAEEQAAKVERLLNDMLAYDAEIKDVSKRWVKSAPDSQESTEGEDASRVRDAHSVSERPDTYVPDVNGVVSGSRNIPIGASSLGRMIRENRDGIDMLRGVNVEAADLASGAFSSVAGVMGVVNFVLSVVDSSQRGIAASVAGSTELLSNMVQSGRNITLAANRAGNLFQLADTATLAAATQTAGVITSSIAFAANVALLAVDHAAEKKAEEATGEAAEEIRKKERLEKRTGKKTVKGIQAFNMPERTIKSEDVERIGAIVTQNLEAKKAKAGMDAVSSAVAVAAYAIPGFLPFGLALSGVAAVAGTITKVVKHQKTVNSAIDEFLGLDRHADRLIELLGSGSLGEDQKALFMKGDEIDRDYVLEELRKEAMRMMGFSGVNQLFEHITRGYAMLMYRSIFFKDNGEPILASDGREITKRKPFRDMLSRLSFSYPETADGYGSPSAEIMARELLGV